MGRLIYSANTSLDGFITDRDGRFDWSVPDSAYHSYITELIRPATTHLYGRRMYDVMAYWETFDEPDMQDFASSWRAADKIVYSRSVTKPWTERAQIDLELVNEHRLPGGVVHLHYRVKHQQ